MRISFLAALSVIAVLIATYSRRVDRDFLQGIVPPMPGCDGRATVEHLLSGIGFGLALTVVFVLGAAINSFSSRHDSPSIEPGHSANLNDGWNLLRALICTFGGSLIYLTFTTFHEIDQAYLSVFSHKPPRGHMQWEQVTADILGTTLAMTLAWLFLVPGMGSAMVFDEAAVMD